MKRAVEDGDDGSSGKRQRLDTDLLPALLPENLLEIAVQAPDVTTLMTMVHVLPHALFRANEGRLVGRFEELYMIDMRSPATGQLYYFAEVILAFSKHALERPYTAIRCSYAAVTTVLRATVEAIFGMEPASLDRTKKGLTSIAMSRASGRATILLPSIETNLDHAEMVSENDGVTVLSIDATEVWTTRTGRTRVLKNVRFSFARQRRTTVFECDAFLRDMAFGPDRVPAIDADIIRHANFLRALFADARGDYEPMPHFLMSRA